ncbi:MAG: transcription elongation factor GreA [Treponema sp.]|jgi:transcription elongation factor GreA|nr:transcription elongation factor GreA [Treponema sp.]
MSEALLKNVQEMLNEEKWTRSTLSNYSTNQFKDMDILLKEAQEKKAYDALKKLCDEHLVHTKTSIIALYLSGMIALSRQLIDDAALTSLIAIFADNHKWNIVQYLCERILDYGESRFALRTLAGCYKNDGDEEKTFAVWERLVKVDFEEADIVKSLAEHYEEAGDSDTAVDYYKKSLHRYINKQLFSNAREIWEKLLNYCPEDIEFFLHVSKKTAKTISEDKAIQLLQSVYDFYAKRGDIDIAINILKLILDYDERDNQARKELVLCYKKKYEKHSQLNEYIRISNLEQNYRNVHEAIMDFEKHIAFDKGNFVCHRTWGVGRIAHIKGDEIVIDFAKQRGHAMSLKMAVNALQTLSKNHIWVLKATWKKEKLYEKVKDDIEWTLKIVIKSFDNACSMKKIKEELSPFVLSAGEWTNWSAKAKQILNMNPSFDVSPDKADVYTVCEYPITIEEKLYNRFKAEKSFFDRAKTLMEWTSQKNFETDSDYFSEMFSYFTGYLKSWSQANEQVVSSYLIVKALAGKFPQLGMKVDLNFADVFGRIDNVSELFLNLKEALLREDFLRHIKLFAPNWTDIYFKLFPTALSPSILDALEQAGFEDKLAALVASCFENYREYRDAVVWFFKNSGEAPWFRKANISFEKQLITLIRILDVTYREIENHRDTTENRKTNKQVYTILFKEGVLYSFIDEADTDTITRLYAFLNDVKNLDPADKLALRSRIAGKRPDFKFLDGKEKIAAVTRGLLVTAAKYTEKQKQLEHIQTVEVPANSKEIEYALSLGDLRENAEYKAAKEKQEILNATVAKLKEEIDRAQIFDPRSVNTKRVSFGTKATLKNNNTNEEEEFTILGPWESDPANKIISYLSPFGSCLLNKAVEDTFEFAIGDDKVSYTVKQISAVEL